MTADSLLGPKPSLPVSHTTIFSVAKSCLSIAFDYLREPNVASVNKAFRGVYEEHLNLAWKGLATRASQEDPALYAKMMRIDQVTSATKFRELNRILTNVLNSSDPHRSLGGFRNSSNYRNGVPAFGINIRGAIPIFGNNIVFLIKERMEEKRYKKSLLEKVTAAPTKLSDQRMFAMQRVITEINEALILRKAIADHHLKIQTIEDLVKMTQNKPQRIESLELNGIGLTEYPVSLTKAKLVSLRIDDNPFLTELPKELFIYTPRGSIL